MEEGSGGKEDKESIMNRWTDTNESALDALKNALIKIGSIPYGRFETKKMKDSNRAYKKMTAKEKNDLMRKLAELDVEDVNDN